MQNNGNCIDTFSALFVKRIVNSVSLSILLLCIPAASWAASLSGDSSTYLQSRESADGSKILGGYEYLDFAVQDLGNDTISFHTGGWLRDDFQTEEYGTKTNSDLQYSYLSFKSKTDNTVINLGRVMVFEGVAAERVDGLYARTDLKAGFGVSAFGGTPVETNINMPGDNVIYGGRLSQGGDSYKIGISALKEEKNSQDYRKEEGIDIWAHLMDNVDITGRSSYNDITKGWMEHTYVLMLGPFSNLRFDTTASWINYDDYFFRATTSALSVLNNGQILDDEKVRILGESATYQATDNVSIIADYKNFGYSIAGAANYYGGMIKYSDLESGGVGIGYHRMAGYANNLKYNEYRVYGYKKLGKFDLTADILDVAYDAPIFGVKDSYSGSLAAQYDLADAWKLGADVEYSHNPDFNRDVRGFVKLLYRFGAKGGA